MKNYTVLLRKMRSVKVEVEATNDIEAEDKATDLYFRGDVEFPKGSPSLEAKILEGATLSLGDALGNAINALNYLIVNHHAELPPELADALVEADISANWIRDSLLKKAQTR